MFVGEPNGTRSDRCRQIAEALVASGLRCRITTHMRKETWVKLFGNAPFNPVSALARTLIEMVRDSGVSVLIRHIMQKVELDSRKMGMEISVSIDQRMAGAEKIGAHKHPCCRTSRLGGP